MAPEPETRTPQAGETLILADGRRFVFDARDEGTHGLWFRAHAADGSCRIETNLRLVWDAQADAWRTAAPSEQQADPPSMWRTSRSGFSKLGNK